MHKAVADIAQDLVELYAKRQNREGYVYGEDTVWQREFEEMFPFEETEDQELAIEATKQDMESKKIMDRLICGDVGYGKTEMAIRAAFKAVRGRKTGGIFSSDNDIGTTALQYICVKNERFSGTGGSALQIPDECAAEKRPSRI